MNDPFPAGRSQEPQGAGGLLTTEVERVDLGRHGGRHLTGRVQRRTLRLAAGGRYGGRLALGRLRPVAIEVEEGSRRYEVPVPRVADPWVTLAARTAALWLGSLALLTLVRLASGRRRRPHDDGGSR